VPSEPATHQEERAAQKPPGAVRADLRVAAGAREGEHHARRDHPPGSEAVGERAGDADGDRSADSLRDEQEARPQRALAAHDLEVEREQQRDAEERDAE
jgi:hypothetical protein